MIYCYRRRDEKMVGLLSKLSGPTYRKSYDDIL